MGLGDAELDDLGAVVVQVALQARLGVDADVEVVDALGRGGGRPHAQGVEVVGDPALVGVLGQVADGEVHADDHPAPDWRPHRRNSDPRCRGRRGPAPPGPPRRWRAGRRRRPRARPRNSRSALRRCRRSTGSELRGLPSARYERVVHGVDRGRDRVGVGALEDQEARDRAARWAARAPRGGRPGSRRRPAAAPAPGRAPTCSSASETSGGSATRSMRRTMSADSMRPPAARKAEASSRSIVREVSPQKSAQRSLT